MVAPAAAAALVVLRGGGQAAAQATARATAVAARTGARAGAKVARDGGRAAVKGAGATAKAGTRTATTAGKASGRAGSRAATTAGKASGRAGSRGPGRSTRAGMQGPRQVGNGARTAAQRGHGSPVGQLLRGGRQDPPGHAGRAGRVGTNANGPPSLVGRAVQAARGGPPPNGGLGQRLLHRAAGTALRRGLRKRWRKHWRKRRRRAPHQKLRERLRKNRRRVVVLFLLAWVLALGGLFGAVFSIVAVASDDATAILAARQQGGAANGGGTLTNAGPMQQALVGAGVPEEYAADFAATASMGIDPRLVAAVAWQESGQFDPDVIACRRNSPAAGGGARGIMQFMPGTASERGVDPCRPGEAITEGARYLLEIYERFGSWDLALAGYNAGPGRVDSCRCVPQNGETERYVAAVNGKWDEYKRTVPDAQLSGPAAIGAGPGVPMGSVERYVEPNITANMQALLDQAVPQFGRGRGIGCYDPSRPSGEHPLGRACDFMMAAGNTQPAPEELERGWRMACWMVQNAEVLQVRYVIWQHQIWESRHGSAPDRRCVGGRAGDGWGHYGRYDGCTSRCLQLQHYDHIHVTVN